MNWIRNAALVLVLPLLAWPTPVLAEREGPGGQPRAAGEITSVDAAAGTFEINTRRGAVLAVFVTEDTVFRSIEGDIQGLEDLEVGMRALVAGEPVEEGISARMVAAARPDQLEGLERFAGEVVRINPGLEQFTLENRAGEVLLLSVGEETRFRSPRADVDGFKDLERGMHAIAVYRQVEGVNLALAVGVRGEADRPGRPDVDLRVVGRIAEIDEASVTIEGRRGRVVTMAITERTVMRTRGGGEPQEGDLAVGLGRYDEDEDLMALLVFALPGRGPAREGRLGLGRPGFGGPGPGLGR